MAYNLNELKVASLDYSYIVNSLVTFLEKQPELKDIDFRNKASAANMIVNILATATAYNGIYTQLGLKESFVSTASLIESLVGIASNSGILISPVKSAKSVATTTKSISDYTSFDAITPDGSSIHFYNPDTIVGASGGSNVNLYAGSGINVYTNWDFETESMLLPYTVDPETISLYEITDPFNPTTSQVKWTRVEKSFLSTADNQQIFTVQNSPLGYLVTTNFANAKLLTTSSSVMVKAVVSAGAVGNSATISDPNSLFSFIGPASGGYNTLSVEATRAKVLFGLSQDRCVTLRDYINAILSSYIPGTDDETLIQVRNGDVPGTVNIYVNGLSSTNQTLLLEYLSQRAPAGTSVVYGQ
jgi:hypothetical protein